MSCASFGKLVYSARVVPHQHHAPALRHFDQEVHSCLETFLAANFSQDEWTLSTLSTKRGGLGLRSACRHSCAAFLASHTACHALCQELDPNHTADAQHKTARFSTSNHNLKQQHQILT